MKKRPVVRIKKLQAVVLAQLVELTLKTQRSVVLILSLAKFILKVYCQLFWKDENKEKEAGNGPFLTQLLGEETLIRGNDAACLEHWAVVGNCKDTADASIGIITLQSPLLTPIRQLNAKFFTSLIKYFQRKGLSKFQRVKNKRTMCVRGGFVVTDIALNSDNPGSKPLKLAFFR